MKKSRLLGAVYALITSVLLLVSVQVNAAVITLGAIDEGTYFNGGRAHLGQEISVGNVDGPTELRNFFTFDLSTITETIVSASVLIDGKNTTCSVCVYRSTAPFEEYNLFDVTSSPADLFSPPDTITGAEIWNDLGSGVVYGSKNISPSDNDSIVTIPINVSGILALNASSGLFSIGGAMALLGDSSVFGDEWLFVETVSPVQLVLETVPVPPALWLFGSGLLGLIGIARRKKAA